MKSFILNKFGLIKEKSNENGSTKFFDRSKICPKTF